MKPPDIAVIGAGPAGLIAAEVLAGAGASVTVHDRMASPARKFLMAGRGGLNLTHSEPLDALLNRYGPDRSFLEPAIRAFPPDALRSWADGLGAQTFVGSSGRIFPKAMKASPLLRAWLARLENLGVQLSLRSEWQGWTAGGALRFAGREHRADAAILALGGASWPRLGSDGSWQEILRAEGIGVEPFRPSNSGVTISWPDHFRERFAGTPLKRVALTCGARTVRGEAMITRRGLEGGAVYALSREIRAGVAGGRAIAISIDLRPDLSEGEVADRLASGRSKDSRSARLRKTLGLSPAAVALVTLQDRELSAVKSIPLTVTGQEGLDRAISTSGGVLPDEVNANFMLAKRPGAFIAGEMLDWDAPTGGYLLQASMATGVAAARGCLSWLGCPGPATFPE